MTAFAFDLHPCCGFLRANVPQYDSLGWSESGERRPRYMSHKIPQGLKGRNNLPICNGLKTFVASANIAP
jgi:hypothetical protein